MVTHILPGGLRYLTRSQPPGEVQLDARLAAMGIRTARQLRDADPGIMRRRFNVNLARTILELRGTDCITIDDRDADRTGQIMFSRSFSTPVTDPTQMHQVLGLYAQQAATRLRHQHSVAAGLRVFASTSWYVSPVHQVSLAGRLPHPADDPVTIVKAACDLLLDRIEPGRRYVRAGISLLDLAPAGAQPMLDPFSPDPPGGPGRPGQRGLRPRVPRAGMGWDHSSPRLADAPRDAVQPGHHALGRTSHRHSGVMPS